LASEHIVRAFDYGRLPDGSSYIVMEYLSGEDLGHVVSRGRLVESDAIRYVSEACEALREAHAAGVVHRDLKPSNLFLTTRSSGAPFIKVLDFGISKQSHKDVQSGGTQLTAAHAVMGSPRYMSPEQLAASHGADSRSDIWSLGVILYHLVSGELPFRASTLTGLAMVIATHAPAPLTCKSPGLEPVIMRCLAKQPAARYATVTDLKSALAQVAATGNIKATAMSSLTRWAIIVLSLTVVAAATSFILAQRATTRGREPQSAARPPAGAAPTPAVQTVEPAVSPQPSSTAGMQAPRTKSATGTRPESRTMRVGTTPTSKARPRRDSPARAQPSPDVDIGEYLPP
ncbi:MAG: hypothetical protein RL701_5160, partial [Pseudomonadota bacterium]